MQDFEVACAIKKCKTDLHEYLTYENKKIITLMPLKSQVRLRLARVRFSRVTSLGFLVIFSR